MQQMKSMYFAVLSCSLGLKIHVADREGMKVENASGPSHNLMAKNKTSKFDENKFNETVENSFHHHWGATQWGAESKEAVLEEIACTNHFNYKCWKKGGHSVSSGSGGICDSLVSCIKTHYPDLGREALYKIGKVEDKIEKVKVEERPVAVDVEEDLVAIGMEAHYYYGDGKIGEPDFGWCCRGPDHCNACKCIPDLRDKYNLQFTIDPIIEDLAEKNCNGPTMESIGIGENVVTSPMDAMSQMLQGLQEMAPREIKDIVIDGHCRMLPHQQHLENDFTYEYEVEEVKCPAFLNAMLLDALYIGQNLFETFVDIEAFMDGSAVQLLHDSSVPQDWQRSIEGRDMTTGGCWAGAPPPWMTHKGEYEMLKKAPNAYDLPFMNCFGTLKTPEPTNLKYPPREKQGYDSAQLCHFQVLKGGYLRAEYISTERNWEDRLLIGDKAWSGRNTEAFNEEGYYVTPGTNIYFRSDVWMEREGFKMCIYEHPFGGSWSVQGLLGQDGPDHMMPVGPVDIR
jgi:hypothetical protein